MIYGTIASGVGSDTGDGGGFFLGNGPLLSAASFDRNSMDSWGAGIVKTSPGGTWYRDGTVVSATASNGCRPGYQLIEAINMNAGTGAQSFGTIKAAQDMAVMTLAAEGDFTKTGTGTLFVSVSDTASNMTVAEGRLTLKSAPSRGKDLPRAWFHADAVVSSSA